MAEPGSLRFCVVSTFYPPYNFGGDGIYAHRLANSLARRGHEVTVLHSPTAYEMLSGGSPSGDYTDDPNVRVHGVRTPLGRLGLLAVQQAGQPWFQAPDLKRWLDRPTYDVIHFNNVSLLGGPHVFRYGSALKLCTLIEHWLVCPMHVLWKFDREVCTEPACLRCTVRGGRPPQLWRYLGLMDRATRSIDAFIGPSLFTMREHRERGIKGTMIQLPLFHPRPAAGTTPAGATNDGRPYFLFVGRLEKIKGVQTIIPIFRQRNDVDLLIAGDGDYKSELERMSRGADNIKFLGRVDHARLHEAYRDAIATVIPSLCYETFGVVAVESFSAGTPVLVYAQSSLEEIVRTHGGGVLYRTEDEAKEAIQKLVSDREFRDCLAREGRAAYETEFAEEPFVRNYLAVVRELLARKRAGKLPRAGSAEQLFAGRPAFF